MSDIKIFPLYIKHCDWIEYHGDAVKIRLLLFSNYQQSFCVRWVTNSPHSLLCLMVLDGVELYVGLVWLFGENPRLSINQHSLYVGVVEKSPPPPLTGEQYGKMEPKYHEGGHCQSVLRPQGVFNVPLYF